MAQQTDNTPTFYAEVCMSSPKRCTEISKFDDDLDYQNTVDFLVDVYSLIESICIENIISVRLKYDIGTYNTSYTIYEFDDELMYIMDDFEEFLIGCTYAQSTVDCILDEVLKRTIK